MILRAMLIWLLCVGVFTTAEARVWTDVTGLYTIQADLIGFDDETVILQRSADKELGAFPLQQLSASDRAFLKSKEAQDIQAKSIDTLQIWTSKDGLKVPGRIVDYARRSITIQRRRGRIYVNNILLDNIPKVYRAMLPMVVGYLEKREMPDEQAFLGWVESLRGEPKTYNLEGVILEFENGDEYGVPFFLFRDQDQKILKAGWETWLQDQDDHEKADDHAFRLQSQAAAYQQNQAIDRQIAIMSLNMQAIQAGLTSAWEVTLYPARGNPNPPRWVVVLGRDSLEATQNALQQNPGYVDGPVRRVSRRR